MVDFDTNGIRGGQYQSTFQFQQYYKTFLEEFNKQQVSDCANLYELGSGGTYFGY